MRLEETVKTLLDSEFNADAALGGHGTLLQIAAREGHGRIAKMLLDFGADDNPCDGAQLFALEATSLASNETLVKELLDYEKFRPGSNHKIGEEQIGRAIRAAY